MTIANYIEEELSEIARKLISNYGTHKVWCFQAEMGAGKTTLIKSLCRELGVTAGLSSPTFNIINEYLAAEGRAIYHFDFYRLKNATEALEIGVEDYFFSGNFCFLEWPEVITSFLPDEYLQISIKFVSENARSLIAQPT